MQRPGTSVVELMFSVLILGVGLSTASGLFPTTAHIQQSTFDDVLATQAAENAASAVTARGLAAADLGPMTGQVQPVPSAVTDATGPARITWTLHDRCYPTPTALDTQSTGGSHYWVPMVQKPAGENYRVFIFILQKGDAPSGPHTGAANPTDPAQIPAVLSTHATPTSDDPRTLTVANAHTRFEIGDPVLTSQGQIRKVLEVSDSSVRLDHPADPATTAIWYAPRSSARHIIQLDNAVR